MTKPTPGLPEPNAKNALRRLLIVLTIALGVLIYSYAWTSTEVDLDLPQEALRQQNLTRAMRELLSPRIFDQDRVLEIFEAPFLVNCETGDAPEQADPASGDTVVVVEPACANAGDVITVRLYNATVSADARIRWQPPAAEGEDVNARPREILELGREDFVIGSSGNFAGTIEVPRIRGGDGEIHLVRVLVAVPEGAIHFSDTANHVIYRMGQTIFMALVATTVAIPIAALISFFAARNLMKEVSLSVGTMLLSFIMLVIGIWIGQRFLVDLRFGEQFNFGLARFGLTVGKGELLSNALGAVLAIVIPVAVMALVAFGLTRLTQSDTGREKRDIGADPLKQVINTLVTTIALIFLIAAFGGLSILVGNGIMSWGDNIRPTAVNDIASWLVNAVGDMIWSVGNLLHIIGTLIELFISPIVGVVTGFGLSSIVGTLFGGIVRRLRGPASHVLGAILGAMSAAVVMAVAASFGLWAALLGILPLVIGGILGGQVLRQLINNILPRNERIGLPTGTQMFAQQLLFGIGFVGLFLFLFNYLNFARSMIDGTLPPQTPVNFLGLQITNYVFRASIVGAVLGGIGGGIAGTNSAFPLGDVLYNSARVTLNMVRSIEPLIMGLVFVIWVGIGPFAGVLALTLHSIASLGKLYSEQIENIDEGPIEALRSTGANQLQTIIYAVVPQIIPPYIAFTMYRWDINVRMSTIIGFVGGGGIGLLLQQQINLLRYRDAGVAVLAIAIVVSILDYASAYIREKLT